jgi:hypothetical protein
MNPGGDVRGKAKKLSWIQTLKTLSWIQLVLIAVLLLAMFAMGYLFVTDILLLFSPWASLYIYEPLYWVTMLFEAVATAYIALYIRFVIAWTSLLKN